MAALRKGCRSRCSHDDKAVICTATRRCPDNGRTNLGRQWVSIVEAGVLDCPDVPAFPASNGLEAGVRIHKFAMQRRYIVHLPEDPNFILWPSRTLQGHPWRSLKELLSPLSTGGRLPTSTYAMIEPCVRNIRV
jgi:hypothetical protein